MKVYLDDIRKEPDGWVRAYNYYDAVELLDTGKVKEISLDHDLGDTNEREMTGYDVALYIVQLMIDGKPYPKVIHVHSKNPVGAENIRNVIRRYL